LGNEHPGNAKNAPMATPGIRDGDDVSKLFIFDTRLGPTEETEHEKVRARMLGCAARDAVPNSHMLMHVII
jgi:hypothetical protein